MSQEDILEILKELGGVATLKDIIKRAKEKYPNRSLDLVAGRRLRALRGWGQVTYSNGYWYIVKKVRN